MSKIIKIRIYRVQDSDLYTIYYDKSFHFCEMAKQAFCAYANGRALPIFSLKGIRPLPKPVYTKDGVRSSGLRFSFVTSIAVPDSDKKAVELANYLLKHKSANAFIKTILRRCLVDIEGLYFEGETYEKFPDPWPINIAAKKNIGATIAEEKRKKKENSGKKPHIEPYKEPEHIKSAPSVSAQDTDTPKPIPVSDTEKAEQKTENGPNLFSFAQTYEY